MKNKMIADIKAYLTKDETITNAVIGHKYITGKMSGTLCKWTIEDFHNAITIN